jgi:hypothetical protein
MKTSGYRYTPGRRASRRWGSYFRLPTSDFRLLLLLLLFGCAAPAPSVDPLEIRLRPVSAEVDRETEADLPLEDRPQARFAIRFWRLAEDQRQTWAQTVRALPALGDATERFQRNGLVLAEVTGALLDTLRPAKAQPGWHASAGVRRGRRLAIAAGYAPGARTVEVRGKGTRRNVVAGDRALAVQLTLRELTKEGIVLEIEPVLEAKRIRRAIPEMRTTVRLVSGQRFVIMRHPDSGRDLGQLLRFRGRMDVSGERQPAGPAIRTTDVWQERCVLVELLETVFPTGPKE